MRALADGRVRWGFWPPGAAPVREGEGICLGEWHGDATASEGDEEAGDEGDVPHHLATPAPEAHEMELEDIEDDDVHDDFAKTNNASFFAALSLADAGDDDDEEDDEE